MAGCETVTTTNTCCAVLKPIFAVKQDTRDTQLQALAYNLKRESLCNE